MQKYGNRLKQIETKQYMNAKNYLDKAKIVLKERKNGREYELGIAGYEFEGPVAADKDGAGWDPEYDGNWLNVSFRVKDSGRDTECLDACLLTWELEHLADNIEYFLSHPEEKEYGPWLTENILDLQFSRRQDGKIKVSVFFMSEGKMSEEKEWETFRFDGIFSERDIRKAVKSLRVFSEAFPYREFEDGRIEGTGWIA